MSNALIIGGASGIGLSIALELVKRNYDFVYIIDKNRPDLSEIPAFCRDEFVKKTITEEINLAQTDYSFLDKYDNINTLIITAGFGRVAPFYNLVSPEIRNLVVVNLLSPICLIHHFYNKIHSNNDFFTLVMGSISGHICSPLFSVYGSTKSGLCSFIENINIELEAEGIKNRILDVSPGRIAGTSFNGGKTKCLQLQELANTLVNKMVHRETLFIPDYDSIYKGVLDNYFCDKHAFGLNSYKYKVNSNRLSDKPQLIIGYLSGTFDLFHIGHLNLLKKAKKECDYLIVGVHKSGLWKGKETFIPFEERCEIVRNIKYVDEVHESFPEDSDAWFKYKYNKLFVGSDYKGSERFQKYELFFADKNVKIIYFPYTKGTSSSQLREKIKNEKKQ